MIRKIVLLCVIASACCQYPRQRAPPMNQGPPPEAYSDYDDYAPPQRQQAPPPRQQAPPPRQQAVPRQNPRQSDILRPATVHYVNIGAELAGDYKFGYDTGKGNDGQSFREETRLPDGTVQGAYGYVDETGTQRIVKYTAGKDGFKVLKDGESAEAARAAPARQAAPAPSQPAYRQPPPQQAYAPQPQPAPQPAYRPPPQPAYRPPPAAAAPAYRAPPAQPQQPAYRAPQPAYAPQPQHRPRSQAPQRPQYSEPRKESYDESQDYDYPNNDISERRLAPVDTSLFNYNIGSSHGNKK